MIVSVWTNLVGKDNTRLALSTDTGNLRLAVSYMDDRYQRSCMAYIAQVGACIVDASNVAIFYQILLSPRLMFPF